jgi:hypothetical protein
VEKKGFAEKKRESDMNNLEGWYKGKKANYHNPQTSTSQVTGINLAKRFAQNKTNQSNNQSNN